MIVITNSGPLMALAKLGLLYLLGRIYGKVEMPEAVYDEIDTARQKSKKLHNSTFDIQITGKRVRRLG